MTIDKFVEATRQHGNVLESGGVNESMPLETQQQKGVFDVDPGAVFRALLLDLRVDDRVDSEHKGKGMCG